MSNRGRMFMKDKICCFCGHRDINEYEIEKKVKTEISNLIDNGVTTFYSGGMGNFDNLCERIVREIKLSNDEVKLYLIAPYMMKRFNTDNQFYEEIIIPDLGEIHYKRAIKERNKWIVNRSNFILCHVWREFGGAWDMLKFAKKQDIKIIAI